MKDEWEREKSVAELTGLEPATSCVTGRHSNQLSYNSPTKSHNNENAHPVKLKTFVFLLPEAFFKTWNA